MSPWFPLGPPLPRGRPRGKAVALTCGNHCAADFLPLEMGLPVATQGVLLFERAGCGAIQRDFSLLCRLVNSVTRLI